MFPSAPQSVTLTLCLTLLVLGAACGGAGGARADSNATATPPAAPAPTAAAQTSPAPGTPPQVSASPAPASDGAAATPLPPRPAAAQTGAEVTIFARKLAGAYEADAAAVEKQYAGKTLAVTGRVESVLPQGPPPVGALKSFSGQPFLMFQGQVVGCAFQSEQRQAALGLRPRQRVTVVGRYAGGHGQRLVLRDCAVTAVDAADEAKREERRRERRQRKGKGEN